MLSRSRLTAAVPSAVMAAALVVTGLTAAVVTAAPAQASGNAQHGTVSTRPSDRTPSFVDGVVYSIAQVGSKVLVGGTFTKVGPGVRGAAGVVDVAGSTFGASFPDVNGAVYAATSDGSGGW